jgi:hypothetical protein
MARAPKSGKLKIKRGQVYLYRNRRIVVIRKSRGDGMHWVCEIKPGLTHDLHEDKFKKMERLSSFKS